MGILEEISKEISSLREEEGDLKAEMAPIQAKLDTIRAQIAHLEGYLGLKKPQGADAGDKEPIIDKMVRVFNREKRPLHYMELMELLEKQEGFLMPGKDPKANLTAKLSGSRKFQRVERGIYVLSEWSEMVKAPQEPQGQPT